MEESKKEFMERVDNLSIEENLDRVRLDNIVSKGNKNVYNDVLTPSSMTPNNNFSYSRKILVNGVELDAGVFGELYDANERYEFTNNRKEYYLNVMLKKKYASGQDIAKMIENFIGQFVDCNEKLSFSKKETMFDASTDDHIDRTIEEKNITLKEFISNIYSDSNLRSDKNYGYVLIESKSNKISIYVDGYSLGYEYHPVFNVFSEKPVFPNAKIKIRDAWRCVLDAREAHRKR